jgi:hypothetical protein
MTEADAYTEANMSAISNVSTDNARLYIYTTARVFLPSLSRTKDFASWMRITL